MAEGRHSFVAFYPSDWLAGTARMARMHRSVYFDICCFIWDTNEPCPKSELPLMFGDIDGWERYVDDLVVAKKLTRNRDGSLSNAKAHAEAKKAFELWEKKSKGGKTGADKTNNSKNKAQTPVGSPAATPDGSSPKMAGSPAAEPEPEPEPELEKEEEKILPPPPDSTPRDLRKIAERISRVGGVVVSPHLKNNGTDIAIIADWLKLGLDIETEIVPAIAQDILNHPTHRKSINYFTPMLTRMAAEKEAIASGKRPAKTARNGDHHPSPAEAIFTARSRLGYDG